MLLPVCDSLCGLTCAFWANLIPQMSQAKGLSPNRQKRFSKHLFCTSFFFFKLQTSMHADVPS